MKKAFLIIFITAITVCIALPTGISVVCAEENQPSYRAIYLADFDTGTVIMEENSQKKYPIASMVKIMTLALTFNEIDKGNLSLNEKIKISEYASSMGGSQMFLNAGDDYTVNDLVKGVIVCSANDAAVALGERISGNIESFVAKMNSFAKELGMKNTLFCNATGLPSKNEQYSTAKDVTIMMHNVLKHPVYFKYSHIWMEDYKHPDGRTTQIVNTNKLIRIMNECDGGKTGFTNEAGFCLSATAKQGETRVIATLLGGTDSKARFRKVSEMIKFAFSNYETKLIAKKNQIIPCEIGNIKQAKNPTPEIYIDKDIKYFGKKGSNQFTTEIIIFENLKAPLEKGSKIGKMTLKNKNGDVIVEAGLHIKDKVEKMSFRDYLEQIFKNKIFQK